MICLSSGAKNSYSLIPMRYSDEALEAPTPSAHLPAVKVWHRCKDTGYRFHRQWGIYPHWRTPSPMPPPATLEADNGAHCPLEADGVGIVAHITITRYRHASSPNAHTLDRLCRWSQTVSHTMPIAHFWRVFLAHNV